MNGSQFDARYYATGCGAIPYGYDPAWLAHFENVAVRIQRGIAPSSMLDAGCAFGLLVATYLLVILVSCLLCVRQRRMIPLPPLVDQSDVVDAAASRQRRNLSRYNSISSSGSSLDGDVATRRRPKGTGKKQNC